MKKKNGKSNLKKKKKKRKREREEEAEGKSGFYFSDALMNDEG